METLTWILKKKFTFALYMYPSTTTTHSVTNTSRRMAANWKKKTETVQIYNDLIKLLDSVLQCQIRRIHTHGCQSAGAFTYRCTAADQADDEEESPDSYDYNSGNQSVHVLEEVVVVIVRDKHVGSDVA